MTTYILETEAHIDKLKALLMKQLEKGRKIALSDDMASFNSPSKRKKSFRFESYFTPDIFGEQDNPHVPDSHDIAVLGMVCSAKIKGEDER